MFKISLYVTPLFALLLMTVQPVHAQEPGQRTITVTGTAEVHVEPDQAIVTVGVITEARTVKAAKEQNDRRSRAVLTLLANNGIPARDIQTSELAIVPVYDYPSKGARKLVHYKMMNTVTVTVKKLDQLEQILDAVLADEANFLGGVDFVVSTRRAIADSLRVAAALDARTKATAVAEALGMKLGKPLTINPQSSSGVMISPRYGMRSQTALNSMAYDMPSTPVSAGEEELSSTVSIIFELE